MPEHNNHLDDLLAAATTPVRPDPKVEEEVLLRLEQEIARRAGEAKEDDSVQVIALDAPSPRRLWGRIGPALLAAAAVVAVLLGVFLTTGDRSVRTDKADNPTATTSEPLPSTTIVAAGGEEPATGSPIELAEAACAETLPGLPPKQTSTLDPHQDDVVRAGLDRLLAITEALRSPIAAFGQDQPQLSDTFAEIEFQLNNSELLFEQGLKDQARYSVPAITAELDQILSSLAEAGAPSCAEAN